LLTQQSTEPGPSAAHPRSQFRALTLVLLSIAFFLSLLDRQILTILVDPLKQDLGISEKQFGLIQGLAFGVFYIALSIPIAAAADRWNRKLIIVGGLFLWSASTVLAAFARSFGGLFTARIGVGLGEACLAPAAYSMLADLYEKKSLARTIGVFHSVGALGVAGAAILGGLVYGKYASGAWAMPGVSVPPWGLTLITVGMPGILLAAIILILVREPLRLQRKQDAAAAEASGANFINTLFANGGALAKLLAGSALVHIASNGFLTWAPSYLIRTFELSPAQGGVRMGMGTAIGAIIGPLIGGFVADKLFARSGHRGTITVLVTSSLLTTFCYTGLLMASTPNQGTAVVALVSVAFSSTLAVCASTIQLQAPSYLRARVSALWLCLNTIVGLGLGAFLVSFVTEDIFESTKAVKYSLAIVAITSSTIGTIVLATMLRRPRTEAAGEPAITSRP
jgi:MFS family permease